MKHEEALQQIEQITKVIESSNKLLFPGRRLIAYGFVILAIPAIEHLTNRLTFGFSFGEYYLWVISFIHIVFYRLLFGAVRALVRKVWETPNSRTPHPLIVQAYAVHRPIVVAIIGTILVLIPTGLGYLSYPFVFILFGIMFNLYGRFAGSVIVPISWSYIAAGLLYAWLAIHDPANSYYWIIFNTYLGLSFLVIGFKNINNQGVDI